MTVLSVAYPFAPVSPDTVGGAEQVLGWIDRALVEAGHRSLVVASEGSRVAGELVATPACEGPLTNAVLAAGRARCRAAIAETLRREAVDVVHLHGVDAYETLPPSGPPAVVTLHLPPSWYPEALFRPSRPDTFLLPVSASQAAACPRGAALLEPIENGVPVDDLARARHARRSFALFLGRICPEKGVDAAIRAARRAGVPLLAAGELYPYPAHRAYFEGEVRPLLDEARRFIGPVGFARKRRLLSAARCVLIPSRVAETSSLVAREAAACGTPVIAFPNGALRDAVVDGVTGFLVDDEEQMASAIGRADRIDPAACRAVARERFDARRMTDAVLDLYARLAVRPALRATP
nr:glycosyltransferase [Alsobacter ponti]